MDVVILVEFPPTYDGEISFVWLNCGPILNYNILFLTIHKKTFKCLLFKVTIGTTRTIYLKSSVGTLRQ